METNINKNKIFQELKNMVHKEFQIVTDDLELSTQLFDGGLYLDSIQMIELTVAIENCYGFEFGVDMLIEDNFRSFDILSDLILKILAGI